MVNWDETPSKFVLSFCRTMTKQGVSNAEIVDSGYKKSITATLVVKFDGKLLPMQLVYDNKTPGSIPVRIFWLHFLNVPIQSISLTQMSRPNLSMEYLFWKGTKIQLKFSRIVNSRCFLRHLCQITPKVTYWRRTIFYFLRCR